MPASPGVGAWGQSQRHDPVFSQLYGPRHVPDQMFDDLNCAKLQIKEMKAGTLQPVLEARPRLNASNRKNNIARAFMSPNARLLSLESKDTPIRRMPKSHFGILDPQKLHEPKQQSIFKRAGRGKMSKRPKSAH